MSRLAVKILNVVTPSIDEQIRGLRASSGRSIRQQAKLAGIHHATLVRWESGETRPSRFALECFLRSFGNSETEVHRLVHEWMGAVNFDGSSGSAIKAMRESCGFSQGRLASALGVQQGTISKWENGVSQPTAAQANRLRQVLTGDASQPIIKQIEQLERDIAGYDLSECFKSYSDYWQNCAVFPVEYGEHWGVQLTNRLTFLAQTDREAVLLLSWIYASQSYWHLARGHDQKALQAAMQSIRAANTVGFDLTNGFSFWMAARVYFTKRTITAKDRAEIKHLADISERRLSQSRLPYSSLVRASSHLAAGNYLSASQSLESARRWNHRISDHGQYGVMSEDYWNALIDSYQKLFALRSREYLEVLSQPSLLSTDRPILNILSQTYDLAALTKVSRENLGDKYNQIAQEANSVGLGFAFSTMEEHIKRIAGIDLKSRCLS